MNRNGLATILGIALLGLSKRKGRGSPAKLGASQGAFRTQGLTEEQKRIAIAQNAGYRLQGQHASMQQIPLVGINEETLEFIQDFREDGLFRRCLRLTADEPWNFVNTVIAFLHQRGSHVSLGVRPSMDYEDFSDLVDGENGFRLDAKTALTFRPETTGMAQGYPRQVLRNMEAYLAFIDEEEIYAGTMLSLNCLALKSIIDTDLCRKTVRMWKNDNETLNWTIMGNVYLLIVEYFSLLCKFYFSESAVPNSTWMFLCDPVGRPLSPFGGNANYAELLEDLKKGEISNERTGYVFNDPTFVIGWSADVATQAIWAQLTGQLMGNAEYLANLITFGFEPLQEGLAELMGEGISYGVTIGQGVQYVILFEYPIVKYRPATAWPRGQTRDVPAGQDYAFRMDDLILPQIFLQGDGEEFVENFYSEIVSESEILTMESSEFVTQPINIAQLGLLDTRAKYLFFWIQNIFKYLYRYLAHDQQDIALYLMSPAMRFEYFDKNISDYPPDDPRHFSEQVLTKAFENSRILYEDRLKRYASEVKRLSKDLQDRRYLGAVRQHAPEGLSAFSVARGLNYDYPNKEFIQAVSDQPEDILKLQLLLETGTLTLPTILRMRFGDIGTASTLLDKLRVPTEAKRAMRQLRNGFRTTKSISRDILRKQGGDARQIEARIKRDERDFFNTLARRAYATSSAAKLLLDKWARAEQVDILRQQADAVLGASGRVQPIPPAGITAQGVALTNRTHGDGVNLYPLFTLLEQTDLRDFQQQVAEMGVEETLSLLNDLLKEKGIRGVPVPYWIAGDNPRYIAQDQRQLPATGSEAQQTVRADGITNRGRAYTVEYNNQMSPAIQRRSEPQIGDLLEFNTRNKNAGAYPQMVGPLDPDYRRKVYQDNVSKLSAQIREREEGEIKAQMREQHGYDSKLGYSPQLISQVLQRAGIAPTSVPNKKMIKEANRILQVYVNRKLKTILEREKTEKREQLWEGWVPADNREIFDGYAEIIQKLISSLDTERLDLISGAQVPYLKVSEIYAQGRYPTLALFTPDPFGFHAFYHFLTEGIDIDFKPDVERFRNRTVDLDSARLAANKDSDLSMEDLKKFVMATRGCGFFSEYVRPENQSVLTPLEKHINSFTGGWHLLKDNAYWKNVVEQTLGKNQQFVSQNERSLAKQLSPLVQQRKRLKQRKADKQTISEFTKIYRSKVKDKARLYIAENAARIQALGSIASKLNLLYPAKKNKRPIWNLPWSKFESFQLEAISDILDRVQVFYKVPEKEDYNVRYEKALVGDLQSILRNKASFTNMVNDFPRSSEILDEYKGTIQGTVVRKQTEKLGSYIGITNMGMRVYLLQSGINQQNITNISHSFNTGGTRRGELPTLPVGGQINQFSTICIGAPANISTYNRGALAGSMLHFAATFPDGHFAFVSTINYDQTSNRPTGIKEIKNLFNKIPASQQGSSPTVKEDNRTEVKYARDFLAFVRDWFTDPGSARFIQPVYGYSASDTETQSVSRKGHEAKFQSQGWEEGGHRNWTEIGKKHWNRNMPLIEQIGTNEQMGEFTMSGADMRVGTSPMYTAVSDCKFLKFPLGASGR